MKRINPIRMKVWLIMRYKQESESIYFRTSYANQAKGINLNRMIVPFVSLWVELIKIKGLVELITLSLMLTSIK